jgi:hypothetical protein
MKIEFLEHAHPAQQEAREHIQSVYGACYGARIERFAPRLVTARNQQGEIVCAAGVRTAQDGFFSDSYIDGGFSNVLHFPDGAPVPLSQVMEVVSVASTTPFPVLGVLDFLLGWGRENGMRCGVFTVTAKLRRLIDRTGIDYTAICRADPSRIENAESWGSYYDQDPWVCACTEGRFDPVFLSPRNRASATKVKAV